MIDVRIRNPLNAWVEARKICLALLTHLLNRWWGDTLFPKKDFSLQKESENFSDLLTTLLFALIRLMVTLISDPIRSPFSLLAFIYFFAFLTLNYQVEDINRFKLEKTACHL